MTDDTDTTTAESGAPTETVERTETGFSVRIDMTRGTGTRDQEKIRVESKRESLEEAREEMEAAKPWLKEFATDIRGYQPEADEEGGEGE